MDKLSLFFKAFLWSIAPISELRGALPYAYWAGAGLFEAFVVCVLSNILVIPLAWLFLATLHKLLYKLQIYRKFFEKVIQRARSKVTAKMKKYDYWGLMLFVGVPLPITGAWTGTLGAWVLGLDKKKAFLFISMGVILSGIIVAILLKLGAGINSILFKRI